MKPNLECPTAGDAIDQSALYLARGDEVSPARPYLTGDVLSGLMLPGPDGETRERVVIILQHPCSMRSDGVHLTWRILAAEVCEHTPFKPSQWSGNYHFMPLPGLFGSESNSVSHAADFDNLHLLSPADVENAERVANLSQYGVNLLMQRYAHYSTRIVVPTFQLQQVTEPFFEEADLNQDWCEGIAGFPDDYVNPQEYRQAIDSASVEYMDWIREKIDSKRRRQDLLKDAQSRSTIRQEMRRALRARRSNATSK